LPVALTTIQKLEYSNPVLLLPSKRKKMFAAFAAFIIFSLIFTMLAMAAILDHECIGDGCPLCMAIKAAVSFLTSIKLIALFIFFAAALSFIIQKPSKKTAPRYPCICSPVILKVRLNT